MIERLIELKPYIDLLQLESYITCNLTARQWNEISQLVKVLQPFMLGQRLLEAEEHVTISLVASVISKIRNGLKKVIKKADEMGLTSSFKELLDKLVSAFEAEWGTVLQEHLTTGRNRRQKGLQKLHILAHCLDPRCKELVGIPSSEREDVWKLLEVETTAFLLNKLSKQKEEEKALSTNLFATTSAERKTTRVFNQPKLMSAPVERLFSIAGLVISEKRSRLKSSTAEDLISLRNSWTTISNLEKSDPASFVGKRKKES